MSDVRSYDVKFKTRSLFFTTNGTATHLFNLPPHSVILRFMVEVVTAFNDSGTDLLDIGSSGTADAYANDVDLSTAGQVIVEESALGLTATRGVTEVFGKYSGQNSNATAGEARVSVVYASPFEN